jgi:hypothetical protein
LAGRSALHTCWSRVVVAAPVFVVDEPFNWVANVLNRAESAILLTPDIHRRHQLHPLVKKATAETIRLTHSSANKKIAARTTEASGFINEV